MSEKVKSSKSLQQFLVPALVIVAIGLAFLSGTLLQKVKNYEKDGNVGIATKDTTEAQPSVSLDTIKNLFGKDLIKFGDVDRKILFVEMADPSCPYCAAADGKNHSIYTSIGENFRLTADGGQYVAPGPEMKKLVDSGQASYAYIYYPGHGNGEMGMKALYCANDAGYTLVNTTVKNDKTKSGTVADFLGSVIDPSFIKSCLDSGKYDARLQSDQELAVSLGFKGTPTFYINATSFPGAYNYTDMKSAIDSALK
ncbi:MAG: Thiol:disulfide interchange protein dsbA [Candidatus Woesebacteria bacterium GW2011_GWC2_40_30]|nr:MAG: Thiol:disulfide interchange protein dsbA [Candidatus Woesebacteria bacterium GW2011_GWC2_40_30]